jgi:hypothetical protein
MLLGAKAIVTFLAANMFPNTGPTPAASAQEVCVCVCVCVCVLCVCVCVCVCVCTADFLVLLKTPQIV